ncbi:hypothetical protein GOP47_0000006 [Adiantum capillus-veneris]|uniref:Uncharacterized protein n=1 Tax=Adiantum capillus-veneris TaxID=13818 RepID=A0A9D4VCR0_ADICA|nr:hypothetical protein GOP47_0000006 [Adiantum capillus-veneris]
MEARYRPDFSSNTGKTLQTSNSHLGFSYSHGQIIPYSEPRMDIIGYPHGAAPPPPRLKNTSSWSVANPEAKRRRRIASYKMYTAEGKVSPSSLLCLLRLAVHAGCAMTIYLDEVM